MNVKFETKQISSSCFRFFTFWQLAVWTYVNISVWWNLSCTLNKSLWWLKNILTLDMHKHICIHPAGPVMTSDKSAHVSESHRARCWFIAVLGMKACWRTLLMHQGQQQSYFYHRAAVYTQNLHSCSQVIETLQSVSPQAFSVKGQSSRFINLDHTLVLQSCGSPTNTTRRPMSRSMKESLVSGKVVLISLFTAGIRGECLRWTHAVPVIL